MNAVGIIAEYNPFHNGHAWQAKAARERSGCAGVIAVMSGHFLQRGEPASFDKWLRAEMAVLGGVDLVLELPTAFAVQSAQFFAEGGIRLLASLGIVSHVSFGAECSEETMLKAAAACAGDPLVIERCLMFMKNGDTYARAFSRSVSEATGIDADILSSPNNILAIEYLRAISKFGASLAPIPVERRSAGYKDPSIGSCSIASATAIRNELGRAGGMTAALQRVLPESSARLIEKAMCEGRGPVCLEDFALPLLYSLRTQSLADLEGIFGVSEGIHHTVYEGAIASGRLTELLRRLKSKRYTATRLQRLLIHLLLRTRKADMAAWQDAGPLYARILAFNDRGRELIKGMKRLSELEVITKTADALSTAQIKAGDLSAKQKMLALDVRASDIYALAMPKSCYRPGGWDFLRSPVYANSC